jgi:hypothetical protein
MHRDFHTIVFVLRGWKTGKGKKEQKTQQKKKKGRETGDDRAEGLGSVRNALPLIAG